MERLWAPWRMDYIAGPDTKKGGCIFCLREKKEEDRQRLVLFRGEYSFVIMNRYPYSNGHLMVAPYRHVADVADLSAEEAAETHALMVRSKRALSEVFHPEGFNIGMNLGKAAGAGVDDHLHLHIVPRWIGDVNFMSTLAEVRVIPEHLQATYERILPLFAHETS